LDGRRFAVTPGALKACGGATHKKGTPTICEYHEPNVSAEAFLAGLARVIRANQTDDGPCVGCRYLQAPTKTPKHPFTGSFFAGISLHDFCGCNSRCVYCAGSEYFLPAKYVASQDHEILFRNLFDSGLIEPKRTAVSWGGGEPTLVKTFDRTVQFLSSNHIREVINTSGIRFSPAIWRALEEGTATVRISVDSGTNGTYSRVKRNRHCDDVWESIRRYAATGGDMIVKYIIFSMNSEIAEVEAFIDRCAAAGVRRICISVDVRSVWDIDPGADRLTERELKAAAEMYNLARSRGMSPYFEGVWSAEHLQRIGELGGFNAEVVQRTNLVHRAVRKARRLMFDRGELPH